MQNIEHVEQKLKLAIDLVDKIKILQLRNMEDQTLLNTYDKMSWWNRPPLPYATFKTEQVAKRTSQLSQLEKECKGILSDIFLSQIPQPNAVSIAEHSFNTEYAF